MENSNDAARKTIFGNIRQGLGRGPLSPDARAELAARVKSHKANLIPQRARPQKDLGKTAREFVKKAELAACSLTILPDLEAIPEAVATYLREHNLGGDIVLAPGDFLAQLPWQKAPLVSWRAGTSKASDLVSLTPALAGVAETGTLIMVSGASADGDTGSGGHPTGLNFTPDHHLVALKSSQLRAGYEEIWEILRKTRKSEGKLDMPRSLNMITGPSRTGDIGLQIHLGAHGPRRLHILLIDDANLLPVADAGLEKPPKDGDDGPAKTA